MNALQYFSLVAFIIIAPHLRKEIAFIYWAISAILGIYLIISEIRW